MKIEFNERTISYVPFEDLPQGALFVFGPTEPPERVYIKIAKSRMFCGCDGYAIKLSDGSVMGMAKTASPISRAPFLDCVISCILTSRLARNMI